MIDQVVAVVGVMLFRLNAAAGVGDTRQEGGLATLCRWQVQHLTRGDRLSSIGRNPTMSSQVVLNNTGFLSAIRKFVLLDHTTTLARKETGCPSSINASMRIVEKIKWTD